MHLEHLRLWPVEVTTKDLTSVVTIPKKRILKAVTRA